MKPETAELEAARGKILSALPDLEFFLTNRCNLRCGYCFVKNSVAGAVGRSMSAPEVRRAVDLYLDARKALIRKYKVREPVRNSVAFTGGEPFLEFDLLAGAAAYLKKKKEDLGVFVMTNGTLLTRERVARLLEADGDLVIGVSLDGGRAVTDAHRKFRGSEASVFDRVAGNLARLPRAYLDNMVASMTVVPQAAGSMAGSVDTLARLGFQRIEIRLDTRKAWPRERVGELRRALRELRAYYLEHLLLSPQGRGARPLQLFFENELQAEPHMDFCSQLSISPEGRFFPCDLPPPEARAAAGYAVGGLETGVDLRKMEAVYLEALSRMREKRPGRVLQFFHSCLFAMVNGRDMAGPGKNLERLGGVFEEELGGVLELQRVHTEMAARPMGGDFGHRPRHFSRKEIGSYALVPGAGDPAVSREKLDYFLYSGGAVKDLAIDGALGGEGAAELLIFYAAAKARSLGKKLRIRCRASGPGFKKNSLSFLKESGALLSLG